MHERLCQVVLQALTNPSIPSLYEPMAVAELQKDSEVTDNTSEPPPQTTPVKIRNPKAKAKGKTKTIAPTDATSKIEQAFGRA